MRGVLNEHIRTLIRETPDDAQFIELVGAMKYDPTLSRRPLVFEANDIPIQLSSVNVTHDDPDEWSASPVHTLYIEVVDYRVVGQNASFGRGISAEVRDWEVVGIDDYAIEHSDAALVKAYLESRPDLLSQIISKIEDDLSEFEAQRV